MTTITRGATTLTPRVILATPLTLPGRSVLHPILGTGDNDLTQRPHGPAAGEVRTIWATRAAAQAAVEALRTPGGPWTFDAPSIVPLTAYAVGNLTIEALTDWGGTWQVTVSVEVAS